MPLKNFKKTSARWNCFKKVDTLGTFDFSTNIVSLDSLETHHVKDLSAADLLGAEINMESYERYKKALPLIVHEYTHFLDSTATVWGLNRLALMEGAYLCPRNNEHGFHKIKTYYDHLRRIKLPDYYTTLDESVSAERPWKYHITSGVEFKSNGVPSKRPIVFVRFYNVNDQAITRTPISIVSLLENTAMAEELEVKASLVRRLGDGKEVEEMFLQKDLIEYIYNPKLTEYSVCAHLLANRQDCQNAQVAFHCSGMISRLVLNTTQETFDVVSRNLDSYLHRYGIAKKSPQHGNIKAALKAGNHGMLFYLISMQLPDQSLDTLNTFMFGLAASLRSLGIYPDAYVDNARCAVERSAKVLRNSQSIFFKSFAEAGLENFERLLNQRSPLNFADFHLPRSLLGDLSQYQFNLSDSNLLKDIDLEPMYEEFVQGQVHTEQFGVACF